MRGDVAYRIYGMHSSRAKDVYLGARRTRAEAEAEVQSLAAQVMHGTNWAARYHDRGFEIREVVVETDFEFPPRPTPRERYFAVDVADDKRSDAWPTAKVEVYRRLDGGAEERVCGFERNHALYDTFEPFRQGTRELALISRDYTASAVLDLATGEVIAEEPAAAGGFCPMGFYVPDWWDVNDGSIIQGSEAWSEAREWPTGAFGFVWGCVWGDDGSSKVQYLDLTDVQRGILRREERFGYVELAVGDWTSPCVSRAPGREKRPPFISVERHGAAFDVRFSVEMAFDLTSGRSSSWERREI